MQTNQKVEAEIMAVMKRFNDAYTRRDINTLLSLCVPDIVLIGTGIDERRTGRDEVRMQAERDWSQTDAATFDWGWYSVASAGSVAWVAAEGSIHATVDGQEMSFPMRLTSVFEQHNGQWLFAQQHVSIPAAGQDEGESLPS